MLAALTNFFPQGLAFLDLPPPFTPFRLTLQNPFLHSLVLCISYPPPRHRSNFYAVSQKLDFRRGPKDLPPHAMLVVEIRHFKPKSKEPSCRAWTCVPLARLFPQGQLGQQANIDLPLLRKPANMVGDTSTGMMKPTKVHLNRIWLKIGAPA